MARAKKQDDTSSPPAPAAPDESAPTPAPPGPAVEVLCDETGRLGALSYLVPPGMVLRPGDAVHVPFGTREVHGMVLGPAREPDKATREVLRVYGSRASEEELALAGAIAERHFSDLVTVAARLAPRHGRGLDPVEAGPLALDGPPRIPPAPFDPDQRRRLLVRAPLVDPARLGAEEAARLGAGGGQVLVLCPTKELVAEVLAHFVSGAARLDVVPKAGRPSPWKAMVQGSLPVAVGTRTAVLWSAPRLAGIVVVEEDHPGHLEATQPYTHARDVAARRCADQGLDLVLISANPTPAGLGTKVAAKAVGDGTHWPAMELIDRSVLEPGTRLLPGPLMAGASREVKAGRMPVVLAGRKARRRCVRCGDEWPCDVCDSSLCRHGEDLPCRRCHTVGGIRMAGWDAERLTQLFSGKARPVTLAELGEVRDAGLVILFDVDAALRAPGFAPEAFASHLVVTAARAAGATGTVVALTNDPAAPLLVDLFAARDQMAVARRAWATARAAGMPPFGRLVTVRVAHATAPRTTGWPGRVFGPQRRGEEWEVLVRLDDAELGRLAAALHRLRRGGKVRVTVE